jgi:methionyl-tRNA synthetase
MGNDGNYDDASIIKRINADLANDLGNLVQRSCSMIYKNCEGFIPSPGTFNTEDDKINDDSIKLAKSIDVLFEKIELNKILSEIWDQISNLNKYFSDQKPWELKKTDIERMNTVLFVTIDNIRKISIMLIPFMPESSNKILDLIGIDMAERTFDYIDSKSLQAYKKEIGDVKPIFPKIDE